MLCIKETAVNILTLQLNRCYSKDSLSAKGIVAGSGDNGPLTHLR